MSEITLTEQVVDRPAPSPGRRTIYAKGDGIYERNSAGVVTSLSSGGGGGGINNVVEDLTPELGGDLDALNHDIRNAKVVTFQAEIDNPSSTTSAQIDWTSGQKQRLLLDNNPTITFVAPPGPCNLTLKVVQDATGNRTVTWPANVRWPNGQAANLTNAGDAIDLVSFYYDGSNYFGVASLNFS